MRKKFIFWAIIAVLLGLVLAAWLSIDSVTGNPRPISEKEVAEKFAEWNTQAGSTRKQPAALVPIDMSRSLRLAVGGLGLADEEKNRQLGDLVTSELTGAKGFELVERQSITAILQELNLSYSGFVRAKDAVRAGSILKADWFFLGTEAKINGTNSVVVRVVDARTGVMRDAEALPADQPLPQLAEALASFLRQTRQNAATPKRRVFLALGAFEDLSLNGRQADFPARLRGYLTTAYQGGEVTLLEREYAETLQQEMQLDLAGLSSGTNEVEPMQSAYWLVGGDYQSYETTNYQVEVMLQINRMLGLRSVTTLRGLPDQQLFSQVKAAIDEKMSQANAALIVSRFGEARAEMSAGKEFMPWWVPKFYEELSDQEAARERRNLTEAIHSFEAVLLLEPTNREAKMYLAACFCRPTINRLDDARALYHEILEDPRPDPWQWAHSAEDMIGETFRYSAPGEKARWFASALAQNSNSAVAAFYRQNAASAAEDLAIENGGADAEELGEKQVLNCIRSSRDFLDGKGGVLYGEFGLANFIRTFADRHEADEKMVELLPKIKAEFPELLPQVTAHILYYQQDTNTPVVAEYEKQLDWYVAHPQKDSYARTFWDATGDAYVWLMNTRHYDLAVKTMEARREADTRYGVEDQVALGYAYLEAGRFTNALALFESFSKMPVLMNTCGPWGQARQVILPGKLADYCREQLGKPALPDPIEFNIGHSVVRLDSASTFALSADGIWLATGDQLLHLDDALRTNLVVQLPIPDGVPITALEIGPDALWIGTDGAGLIEYDKSTRQCRQLTVKDGLMMDAICCLLCVDKRVWIGYGEKTDSYHQGVGGLGVFDPAAGFVRSYARSMTNGIDGLEPTGWTVNSELPNEPPHRPVIALTAGPDGDIWSLDERSILRRFQPGENIWMGMLQLTNGCRLAADATQLYAGQFEGFPFGVRKGPVGLAILRFRDGQCRSFDAFPGLPSKTITALACDGNELWAGGMGFVARFDVAHGQLRNISFMNIPTVDKIQIGGGYVWAHYNGGLHRMQLSALK